MSNKIEVAVISGFGDQTSTVSVFNAQTGTFIASYRGGGTCAPHGLFVNGGYVVASQFDKPVIKCWPLNKQHADGTRMIAPGKITCTAISPDSNFIAVGVEGKVYLYQACTGRVVGSAVHHYQDINVIKFSSDGSLLVAGANDGLVTIWNVCELTNSGDRSDPWASYMHSLPVTDLRVTFGGLRGRVFSVSGDQTCKIFDLFTKQILHSILFTSRLTAVELLPNETGLFVGNGLGGIYKINLHSSVGFEKTDETEQAAYNGHSKSINCLSCSVDGSLLLSGSADETVKIWHVLSYQCIRTLSQKGSVTNAFFYIGPKDMLSPSFKPSGVFHDFIRSVDVNANEDTPLSIRAIESCPPSKLAPAQLSVSSADSTELLHKLSRLENINHSLYKFSLQKIITAPKKKKKLTRQIKQESV